MSQISCSPEGGFLAVSVANILHVIKSNSDLLIFKYVNELNSSAGAPNSNFIKHVFSASSKYLGAITEDKKLLVWNIVDNYSLCYTRELAKRPTCLAFCNKEDTAIVGDKSGDVFRHQLADSGIEQEQAAQAPILGHLSMVLDVALSPDDGFIVSADRDEKIRVSFYPNAYSIHSYCLGHGQLVSTISLMSNDLLISGSADNTLRLWRYKDGAEVNSFCISAIEQSVFVISKVVCYRNNIAVIGEGLKSILLFTCDYGQTLKYDTTFQLKEQPYDICYRDGVLFALVQSSCNKSKEIITLQKENGSYVQKEIWKHGLLQDFLSSTASVADSKYFTNLVKPTAKKRTNIEITPESTIHYEPGPKQMKVEA